ncbi:3-isopropylmalate dehydratase small subunit [Canibacter zhoujuaniae]|uniref:3-isopropylmalate dehydratase small subunit n=1 Tax=Canibacter zhoujuaniae TaxID=2708343 RepID=UPI0014215992|nr:3-isopropylmalate dehydratase small subunit [Canibacter zhoujuaniae]
MEPIRIVTGKAAAIQLANIDTDQILPAQFLKRITKTGFEDALFFNWRQDPDFLLNHEPAKSAKVLVAGPDFGIGSSREHAVWALRDFGFRVVISARFGDIFRGNAGKQGLLTAQITEDETSQLWQLLEADPEADVTVDLEELTITCKDLKLRFQIDEYTRWRLLEGLDDISLTLQNEDAIAAYEAQRPTWMPTTI